MLEINPQSPPESAQEIPVPLPEEFSDHPAEGNPMVQEAPLSELPETEDGWYAFNWCGPDG